MTDQKTDGSAFFYVTTLFFAWGFVTSIIDPLIPSVRSVFTLTFAESMLTQFAWFIAYGIVSLPAAALLARLGFATSIVVALAVMVIGCLIVPLATIFNLYAGVLLALFVIASGVTLLQVAANPLVAVLGRPERSHFRLTFSQAFNSLGTVLGPNIGALIMLSGGVFGAGALANAASREETLRNIDAAFLVVAAFFAALCVFIWLVRKRISAAAPAAQAEFGAPWRAFGSGWAMFGALAIFVYVGSEVAIGSLMINFLIDIRFIDVMRASGMIDALVKIGLFHAGAEDERIAGQALGLFYWGGAMVGRFVGSWLLTRVRAGVLLGIAALCAGALCLLITQSTGAIAGVAALSIGLFNSIMFPTIFTLTMERSTAPASATSGLLCMAIVGGAVLPYLAGQLADAHGLNSGFWIPLGGYACIVLFALAAARGAKT
ncbi:MAG: MFS transporter [Hyphomonadaceae bacterium]|nr:MFS transporter [Hyphomonadaceae bacterium]